MKYFLFFIDDYHHDVTSTPISSTVVHPSTTKATDDLLVSIHQSISSIAGGIISFASMIMIIVTAGLILYNVYKKRLDRIISNKSQQRDNEEMPALCNMTKKCRKRCSHFLSCIWSRLNTHEEEPNNSDHSDKCNQSNDLSSENDNHSSDFPNDDSTGSKECSTKNTQTVDATIHQEMGDTSSIESEGHTDNNGRNDTDGTDGIIESGQMGEHKKIAKTMDMRCIKNGNQEVIDDVLDNVHGIIIRGNDIVISEQNANKCDNVRGIDVMGNLEDNADGHINVKGIFYADPGNHNNDNVDNRENGTSVIAVSSMQKDNVDGRINDSNDIFVDGTVIHNNVSADNHEFDTDSHSNNGIAIHDDVMDGHNTVDCAIGGTVKLENNSDDYIISANKRENGTSVIGVMDKLKGNADVRINDDNGIFVDGAVILNTVNHEFDTDTHSNNGIANLEDVMHDHDNKYEGTDASANDDDSLLETKFVEPDDTNNIEDNTVDCAIGGTDKLEDDSVILNNVRVPFTRYLDMTEPKELKINIKDKMTNLHEEQDNDLNVTINDDNCTVQRGEDGSMHVTGELFVTIESGQKVIDEHEDEINITIKDETCIVHVDDEIEFRVPLTSSMHDTL